MNLWLTIYRLACAAFAVILVIAILAVFFPKVRQARERTRRAAVLEEENRAKEEQIKRLRQQQERFATDPGYVERVAREELGKVKPDETIFRFSERKTNDYRVRQ